MSWSTRQDKADYAHFCAMHPRLPIFFFPWYLDAVAQDGQWDAVTLFKDHLPVAAWPYFHKRRFGLHYVSMPPFTKYLGPISRDGTWSDEMVHHLYTALPPLDGWDQNTSTRLGYNARNWEHTFALTEQYLHQITFSNNSSWQEGINRNMRRNIRKAKAHLSFEDNLSLEDFFQLNTMSFERQGLPLPYSFDQLNRHDQALQEQDARAIFGARDKQGQLHSAAYLIWDNQAAYYHLSGDHPELRSSGSGIWILAQAIDYTQQILKKEIFDFEGSMLPSVEKIRIQFGAHRTPYFRIKQANDWRYRLLKRWRG